MKLLNNLRFVGSAIILSILIGFGGYSILKKNKQNSAYLKRSQNASAQTELLNLYLACSGYWGDNDSDQPCSLNIVNQPRYGYIQGDNLVVKILMGSKDYFLATAFHEGSGDVFSIDGKGEVVSLAKSP
jgi:hypothetical protein